MSDKSPGMNMRELVIKYGGPLKPDENLKGWFNRVARELSTPARRVEPRMIRAAFHNEITNENHWLNWKIKEALRLRNEAKEATGSNELAALKNRMATLERRLQQIDPDFHSSQINPMREPVRDVSRVDRP